MRKNSVLGKRKEEKSLLFAGYMTVEATLVMPVVLYLCVFIIYSGVFIYDRCVMKQDAYRAALRGSSISSEDNEEAYLSADKYLETIAAEKYIAAEYSYAVSVKDKVKVTVTGYIDVPFRGFLELTGRTGFTVAETAESKCFNPVLFIRMCRQLSRVGETSAEE